MFVTKSLPVRPLSRLVAGLAVACLFAGCGKQEPAAESAATGPAAATAAAAPTQAVSAKVAAMSADQLRDAASTALREQRLYAPAGDNAMEYYLALRDKQPADASVSSALTDLMPYALIATEQSIARDDFTEAQRLYALMEKAGALASAFSINAYSRCASLKSSRPMLCSVAISAYGIRSVSALATDGSFGCLSRRAR